MNLQEHIRKVLREEKKTPAYILRRLNFSNLKLEKFNFSNISDDMKKNSLRMFKKGVSLNSAISRGASFTTGEIIPWHDEEGREYDHDVYNDLVRIFKEYLIENYGKETEEYLLKVLPEDSFSNDGHKYVFWKHSEINGGEGFGDTFNSWGDLILNYGWWFPLNWWEIKSELDNISEGRKIILRPGDKHNNFGYYFSIIKKKSNIQEHIRKVLREETQKISPFILRRVNFNNIKKHIDKHLEEELEYLANRQWAKSPTKYAKEHSVRIIIEKVIDAVYIDSKFQLPIDVRRTYYSELEDYIKNKYYDYIYDSVKEYYSYYSKRKNK